MAERTRAVAQVADALRHAAARLPDLLAPGHKLVVGYSGGQDSTCLLHALSQRGLDLVAAHVDHGLRPESADQALQVAGIAHGFGVACEVRRIDLRSYQSLTGWGVQQAARAARYQVLAAIAAELGAEGLLVAHTADDQAETVLLNLLRGAGLKGLSGMRLDERLDPAELGPTLVASAPVRVARPLLRVSRATTLAYCQELGLDHVEDPSNFSGAYTRNRVRLELLPLLERFNPGVRAILARTADLAAEDELALDELAHVRFADLATRVDPHVLVVRLDAWREQPRALQRRLLRLGLRALLGGLVDVPDAPIEDALDLLDAAGRSQDSRPGEKQPRSAEPTGTAEGEHLARSAERAGTARAYHLPGGVELGVESGRFVLRLGGQAQAPRRVKSWGKTPPRV
jgi:tRNA(Ile)-lysidine synthetase-like protein